MMTAPTNAKPAGTATAVTGGDVGIDAHDERHSGKSYEGERFEKTGELLRSVADPYAPPLQQGKAHDDG